MYHPLHVNTNHPIQSILLEKKPGKMTQMSKFSGKEFIEELRGLAASEWHAVIITNNQLKVFTAGEPPLTKDKTQTANFPSILSLSMKSFGLFSSWEHSKESLICFSDTNHGFFSIYQKPHRSFKEDEVHLIGYWLKLLIELSAINKYVSLQSHIHLSTILFLPFFPPSLFPYILPKETHI